MIIILVKLENLTQALFGRSIFWIQCWYHWVWINSIFIRKIL